MRRTFRLVKARQTAEAFSGEGARLYGGCWNKRGTALVYTSESLALAVLEQFVHLGPEDASFAFVFYSIDILDDVSIEEIEGKRSQATGGRNRPRTRPKPLAASGLKRCARPSCACLP